MTCIRCKGDLVHVYGRGWHCQPGCQPSVPGYHLDDETHNCDHCGARVASRGLIGIPSGVYCSAECIGQAYLTEYGGGEDDRLRSPVCDDGPTSDRYGGTCSPSCMYEGERRIIEKARPPREVARSVLAEGQPHREWSHRVVRGGAR